MNEKAYPRLGQRVLKETLPNGLRIYLAPKQGFSRSYVMLATDYGSIDTSFMLDGSPYTSPAGIAHYLEHKMFDMPNGNGLQELSATGASPNAFTSYNMTAYYFSCTDRLKENLEILLSFVSQGYFTDESVEKERGIIAQEIKMYADSPDSCVEENLFSAMYQNHPIRENIAGTVESIQEITPQTLRDCHGAFYQPSNMVLCVSGDVTMQQLKNMAERILPKTFCGTPERFYGIAEPPVPGTAYVSQQMEVSMPLFSIGFKGAELLKGPERFREEIVGDLAAEVLCGESSPLYLRLYEEGLIDSGFSYGYSIIKGLAAMTMGGDSSDPKRVLREILAEAERIVKDGVDEGLFRRLKRASYGHRIRGLDSMDGICYRMAIADFDEYDYFSFPEIYDAVSAEDVRQLIRTQIVPEKAVLSVIFPKEKECL